MSGDGPSSNKESSTATNECASSTLIVTNDESEPEKSSESKTIDLEKLVLEDSGEDGEKKGDEEEPSSSTSSNIKEHQLEDDYVDEEVLKAEEEKLSPEEISERFSNAKAYKDTGNLEFKEEKYKESILSYTKGLLICPLCEKELRSILYANRGVAKMKLNFKDLAVMDCTKSIEYNPKYIKALIRRAALYEELDKLDESLEDYKKILELDPTYRDAIIATQRLPPLINERNEKLKTEMIGKLKDLGNLVLRPFGLSTENFHLDQQPGGGYSINFKK